MSRSTVITRSCDRCRAEQVEGDAQKLEGWGRISAFQFGKSFGIGVEDHDDLCPSCIAALIAWYADPNGDPPPPPPPPLAPPPVWKLTDRANAIVLVQEALRVRVAFALEVVRNEPTSILSGEMIPGALFGIEDTAAGIVDGVLDQLGLQRRARS